MGSPLIGAKTTGDPKTGLLFSMLFALPFFFLFSPPSFLFSLLSFSPYYLLILSRLLLSPSFPFSPFSLFPFPLPLRPSLSSLFSSSPLFLLFPSFSSSLFLSLFVGASSRFVFAMMCFLHNSLFCCGKAGMLSTPAKRNPQWPMGFPLIRIFAKGGCAPGRNAVPYL